MEEKKLTDEEKLLKQIRYFADRYGTANCIGNPNKNFFTDVLDLIHRLQSENKELRTESDKMVAEHLAFVELSKKANEQQKSEIAELKAQCSKSSYRDSWKNKFFKAQEEIERLNGKYRNLEINYNAVWEDFRKYEIENTELQKRVDELKESANGHLLTSLYKKQADDHKRAISVQRAYWENKVQQSVKDTAKEILTDFYLWIGQDFDDIPNGGFIHIMKEDFKRRMKELYNRYGVEVE